MQRIAFDTETHRLTVAVDYDCRIRKEHGGDGSTWHSVQIGDLTDAEADALLAPHGITPADLVGWVTR